MFGPGCAQGAVDEDERVGLGTAAFGTQPTLGPGQRGGPEQLHTGQQVEQPEVARLDARREQVGQGVGGNVVQRGAGRLVHSGRAVFPPPDDQRDEREQVVLGEPRRPAQGPLGQHPAGGQLHDGGMRAAALTGAVGGMVLRVGEEIQGGGGGEHVDPAAQIRPQHGARHPGSGQSSRARAAADRRSGLFASSMSSSRDRWAADRGWSRSSARTGRDEPSGAALVSAMVHSGASSGWSAVIQSTSRPRTPGAAPG